MASARWTYDTSVNRYRDEDTGRFLARATIRAMRDEFLTGMQDAMLRATQDLIDGGTLGTWERTMRTLVKDTFAGQYLFGRGGRNAMTAADWGALGEQVREQYQYLHRFAQDLADGTMTPAQALQRAGLYAGSSVQAHERGAAESWGVRLPRFPGDGQTACKAQCRCHLDYQRRTTEDGTQETHVYWRLSANAEHCADCPAQAMAWNPLVLAAS